MFHNSLAAMIEYNMPVKNITPRIDAHDGVEAMPLINATATTNDQERLAAIINAHHKHCQRQLRLVIRHAASMSLDRDIHIDTQDTKGQTALMRASSANEISSMRLLISGNANKELKNVWGMTALMLAVSARSFHGVAVLINAGANLHATNLMGATALTIAQDLRDQTICKLLIKAAKRKQPSTSINSTSITHTSTSRKKVAFGDSSRFFSSVEVPHSSEEQQYNTLLNGAHHG